MGYNMFESAVPVNMYLDACTDAFGDEYNRTSIDAGVRFSNYLYGGQDNYNGTNVVFVNGSEDPWHVLSVFDEHPLLNPDSVVPILMSGTSHCEDMWHTFEEDEDVLKKTRRRIRNIIGKWIKKASANDSS